MDLTALFPKKSDPLEIGLLLPLRNMVLLPGIALPIVVGRRRSLAVAESSLMAERKQLIVAAIRPEAQGRLEANGQAEVETLNDIYPTATLATVQKMLRLPVGSIQLLLEGQERVRIHELLQRDPTFIVKYQLLPAVTQEGALAAGSDPKTLQALVGAIESLWQEAASLNPNFPEEVLALLLQRDDPVQLAYQTATLLQQEVPTLQAVLEQDNLERLLRQVLDNLQREMEVQRLRREILGETQKEIDQQQREFILRQQMRKIQEELGEVAPEKQEIEELRQKLAEANLPEAAQKQAQRELARLERLGGSNSAEGGVIRTYLDWLSEMPWNRVGEDNLDLQQARAVLDADHHDLEKVKDRIIEYLATFKLKQAAQSQDREVGAARPAGHYHIGTVLCFSGPPGVGKTSLGQSIARALGRPFERISLGGLRDEAELRGHRRTYIGAMPGRIVQALHRAKVKNPAILLDELDKVGMDYRGDPAAALLEILDPQQNSAFRDLYLDLDFDLSQVFFIATANDLSRVPAQLLDRLEIIELSGYSEQEKLAIAQRYLLPRQLEKAGLPPQAVQLPPETLRKIVTYYTREAGVRKLEQQLGTLCRQVAVRHASGETTPVTVHPEQLEEMLGPWSYWPDQKRKAPQPGVATGLAWTLQGGEVLFVEAVLLPEGKDLTLTGHLGEVMQESAQIARSYVWSQASHLGIDAKTFKDNGLHLHIPAGAIAKDGPSAGVTMAAAIASRLLGRGVRADTAMTGEINLSGDVLPVGGVREKVLAAHRAGIRRVLLPQQNEKDLGDVPEDVREQVDFIFCTRVEQVLEDVLVEPAGGQKAPVAPRAEKWR